MIEISLESVAATAVQKCIEVVYTVGVAEDIPCGLLGDSFRVKQILCVTLPSGRSSCRPGRPLTRSSIAPRLIARLNLLSNACKFCPHNSGAIVEVTSSAEAVGDRLRITVSVKDTGPGIAASKMSRLFKTFSQVDSTTTRQHGGSGLGLAISKSLANLMGGDAWAESTLGEGATFSFSFMADKDAHSVTPVRSVAPSSRSTGSGFTDLSSPRARFCSPAHALPKSAFIVFRACAMRHALEKQCVSLLARLRPVLPDRRRRPRLPTFAAWSPTASSLAGRRRTTVRPCRARTRKRSATAPTVSPSPAASSRHRPATGSLTLPPSLFRAHRLRLRRCRHHLGPRARHDQGPAAAGQGAFALVRPQLRRSRP